MSNKGEAHELFQLTVSIVILGVMLMGLLIVPILALMALPAVGAFVGYKLWKNNTGRLERAAESHNRLLYEKVCSGTLASVTEEDITYRLDRHLRGNLHPEAVEHLLFIGRRMVRELDLNTAVPPPPLIANSLEGARYRDRLATISTRSPEFVKEAIDSVAEVIGFISQSYPHVDEGEATAPVRYFIPDLPDVVQEVYSMVAQREHLDGVLKVFDEILDDQKRVMPSDYKGTDVVEVYLKNTPLVDAFDFEVSYGIPERLRVYHHHIVAALGSGKSSLIRDMVMRDAEGDAAVIVIDSQVDLINDLLSVLDLNRVILIDPADVEFPLAFNLLDISQGKDMSAVERQASTNNLLELFVYLFSSLLDTELTAKQKTAFQFVTRLLLTVPGANLTTMRELFAPGGEAKYDHYISQMNDVVRAFFTTDFGGPNFKETRSQIAQRLYTLQGSDVLYATFNATQTKLSLFDAIEEGKIILVNSAKGILGREGAILFNRFIVALVRQACFERQFKGSRRRTYLYLDEAHEYLDSSATEMLEQARKYNLGLILAHQHLGQLRENESAVHALTGIKMCGKLESTADMRVMANVMRTGFDDLKAIPSFTFMTYLRDIGTLPYRASIERFNQAEKASDWELEDLRYEMRELYCSVDTVPPKTPPPPPPEVEETW